ncbi:hypothetical protein CCHR01_13014 [Colletotrichum chrysophilum]|uniref:Uncharacterized protein n=1 Tax=Colletotrichum chrysophilum TaxID=1836956 RepID=A0AAD9AA62_9PEZI|nr:hypothetical protein CCHR01_13014 [Colletotrichum chrysophilum]
MPSCIPSSALLQCCQSTAYPICGAATVHRLCSSEALDETAYIPGTNHRSDTRPQNHHCQHHTSHFVADFRVTSHFNTLLSATLKLSKNAPARISILSSEPGISLAKRRLSADDNIASHLPVHV